MSDLIRREDVEKTIRKLCDVCGEDKKYNSIMCGTCNLDSFIREYEDLPSAEPERKKGTWIYDTERVAGDGWTYRQYHCSECGFQEIGGLANFCPNCGADMRGD